MCLMRPPSDSPKTRMNRNELRIGAATVCVHSFRTRCDSRALRAISPRWRATSSVTAHQASGLPTHRARRVACPVTAMECAGRRRVCPDMGGYIFDQRRSDEHERLACMELLWDPGTRTVLESLGIGPGWRCLEIGAGAGSIARWLAEKVWPDGEVLATDISTRHLDWLAEPNLQIRQHDILNDPLPDDHFDL